ncbi:MAG TPA: glycosyltransferase family 2 protein [Anaerolineaceae bacterium]|nr:glycosyltransferase family 2 protein [Anaerolineaceae bacterium]
MNLPTVSIVTPCYNAARFIRETIESVRGQPYPHLEHIVIDGGSTDGTLDILKAYPHLRWVSAPDRGQSHALNKGFAMARGELIGWLNADDTYAPGAVSTAVDYLLQHPEAGMVCSDMWIVGENGKPLRLARGKPFDLVELLNENYVRQATVFIRRQLLNEVGGVNESLHYCMDRALWLRVGVHHQVAYLPGVVSANFRFYWGSKTSLYTPGFVAEWLGVLTDALDNPLYQPIPRAEVLKAIEKYQVRHQVALMRQAARQKDPRSTWRACAALLSRHWRYLLRYPYLKTRALLAAKR